jgi:hypothetical protein
LKLFLLLLLTTALAVFTQGGLYIFHTNGAVDQMVPTFIGQHRIIRTNNQTALVFQTVKIVKVLGCLIGTGRLSSVTTIAMIIL